MSISRLALSLHFIVCRQELASKLVQCTANGFDGVPASFD